MQPMKSPGLAAVLSFFVAGLGQVYVGRFGRAALYFGLHGLYVFMWVVALLVPVLIPIAIVGTVLYAPFWMWNIWSAYKLAERFNRELGTDG